MGKILKKEFLSKNKKKLFLIILAVAILSITAVGYVLTFNQVTIIDGEEELSIKTRKDTVQEVLEEQEVSYIKEDAITPSLNTTIEDGTKIVIKRAVDITIEADDKTFNLLTPVEDVAAAIRQAGLTLGEEDDITPSLDEKLKNKMKIVVTRAVPCYIEVDGEKVDLLTTVLTVQEAIQEAQISLGDMDKISPSLEESIEEDTIIKIIRVTEETKTIEEDIDFKTIKQNASDMNKGTTKVVKNGEKGIKEKEVKITYEDGEEVNREVLEEKVIKEPVDKVIKVGTKPLPKLDTSRGGDNVVGTLNVTATAYSSQDPGVGSTTRLGKPLRKGVIAVDPSVIPFHTRIYVPGYGFGIALDTGGAIKGNKIDVAFDTRAEALRFGRKNVTIKIYGK
jgi:uncharacterized protein YabE (DUF348 family)